jgi:hypothetical protein
MEEKHGYWIHHRTESDDAVGGFFYTRECDCSVCGKTSNLEKPVCPYCGAIMDQEAPGDKTEN